MTVIDGSGAVLGRLATNVAKRTLKGEYVDIVNAREIIIIGKKEMIFKKYKEKRRDISCAVNPYRGMHFPRTPEGIVKWSLRGMVGHKSARGRKAMKCLKVHRGIPESLSKSKAIKINDAVKKPDKAYVTIDELSKFLGFKG
ncbi:MAG: 50S ribosomal protein L13 [Candidatus Diapherotrites archaeon]|nr:50S ribosomal protein L13 [Candidatus Diapherotrites archaeon]